MTMKTLRLAHLLYLLLLSIVTYSQNTKEKEKAAKAAEVQNMVESKRFVFHAQSAMPTKFPTQQLSPGYTFKVLPEEVVSDLPYFGRSYQAPMNPSESGIKFTSSNFDYTTKTTKKGSWEISIVPKDVRNSPKIYLTVSPNGNTSLRAIGSDKQPISFNGFIEEPK